MAYSNAMADSSLHDVLNDLFADTARTNAAQARELEFDAARLSRLRTGTLTLSESVAGKLADKLAELAKGEAGSLKARLLAASKEGRRTKGERVGRQPASIQNAIELFKDLARPGAFLAVEYRDWPVTPSGGPYGEIAELAGKAIAHGLSFAMFVPFRIAEKQDRTGLPQSVWLYRDDLVRKARYIYGQILGAARRAYRDSDEKARFVPEQQLVLYERAENHGDPVGFQSRIFYVIVPVDGILPRTEVWEWVAVAGEPHAFLLRANIEEGAIFQQFFQVTAYWHNHEHRLPVDKSELKQGLKDAVENGWFDKASGPAKPASMWEISPVYEKPKGHHR
jgi:hypothetical protein